MRREFGYAAHFIGASNCLFHRTTQIGRVMISTVGDYRPFDRDDPSRRKTIGLNRFYETMVFPIDGVCTCGCGLPEHDGREIDFAGYQTALEADAGHEAMCMKYETIPVPAIPAGVN